MFTNSPVFVGSTGPFSVYTSGDLWPTRHQELLTVQATLRRLQLTPEEAIKIVSAHIQELKRDAGEPT